MKAQLVIFLGCLGIIMSGYAFADCGGGGCGDYYQSSGCESGSCGGYADDYPGSGSCCEYQAPCQCTDPGYKFNDCISKCEYCEAFGNVGGR